MPSPTPTLALATGFAQLPHHLIDSGVLNELRPSAIRVLLLMLRMADRARRCWPSLRAMAERLNMTERGVQKGVEALVERGLVRRESRGNSGRATRYRLDLSSCVAPVREPPSADASRTRAHPLANADAASSRTAVPTNNNQDQEPASTSSGDAMCASIAGGKGDGGDGGDGGAGGDADASASERRRHRMTALGVSDGVAMNLLMAHAPLRLDDVLANAEFLTSRHRLGNPAGYVVDSLRRNYGPLPERLDYERREARRRHQRDLQWREAAAARERAAAEAQETERVAMEALALMSRLSDKARAEAVREALASQPSSVRAALEHRDPRVSRNLAILVRDHLRTTAASASASVTATASAESGDATRRDEGGGG